MVLEGITVSEIRQRYTNTMISLEVKPKKANFIRTETQNGG